MIFRSLRPAFDRLSFLISVPKCVSCGRRLEYGEAALCTSCLSEYENIKSRNCSICSKVLSRCSCTNPHLKRHYIKKVIKLFRYKQREENKAANSLIYSLKRDNRDLVLDFCAKELAEAVRSSLGDVSDYVITNVPRRRLAVIKHGIDHAALLAKALAKETNSAYVPLLRSRARRAQKTLFGKDRLLNAEYDLRRGAKITAKKVIIVDDIITTGASMSACAMLIRGLGAKYIVGASLAIAYKDNSTPLI